VYTGTNSNTVQYIVPKIKKICISVKQKSIKEMNIYFRNTNIQEQGGDPIPFSSGTNFPRDESYGFLGHVRRPRGMY
jgi:hypothetical protein